MQKWKFAMSAALVAVLAALAFVPVSHAAKKEYWKGRPEIKEGEVKGYFIWEDGDGFHARWTTKGGKSIFSGTVTCDGEFMQFEAVKKDEKDLIKKDSATTIRFDARTQGGVDGFNVRVSPSTRSVTFNLKIDGAWASAQDVRLGEKKERPSSVPFTIDRLGGSSTAATAKPKSGAPAPR
jgi:hypothetical protein